MATVNDKMTAVADAIREITGETELLTLDDMATDISKVYEAGKKSQYDKLWDTIQEFGKRENYSYTFGLPWNEELWIPKYDIRPTTANRMLIGVQVADLVAHQSKYNFVIDFSRCTTLSYLASGNRYIEHIGVVDTRSADKIEAIFNSCWELKKVDEFILREDGSQTFSYPPFGGCNELTDLTITGCIGNTVSFNVNPLTPESVQSIIDALKDISGEGRTPTLTLQADVKVNLSESDIATITQKGWTLA